MDGVEKSAVASVAKSYGLKKIHQILLQLDINVELNDLKHPSIDTLTKIYRSFGESCLGMADDVFLNDPADLVMHFNDEDTKVQAENFKLLQFYVLTRALFSTCGHNVSFSDVFFPSKVKFNKFANDIITLACICSAEMKIFEQVSNECKEYVSVCEDIQREVNELKNKNYAFQLDKREKKALIDQAYKRISIKKEKSLALQQDLSKYKHQKEIDDKEMETLEAEMKELETKLEAKQKKLTMYDRLLIKSPERLSQDLVKIENRINEFERFNKAKLKEIETERKAIADRDKFVVDLNAIFQNIENFVNNELQNSIEQLNKIKKIEQESTNKKFNEEVQINQTASLEVQKGKIKSEIDRLSQEIEAQLAQMDLKEENFSRSLAENNKACIEKDAEKKHTLDEKKRLAEKFKTCMEDKIEAINQIRWNTRAILAAKKAKTSAVDTIEEMHCKKIKTLGQWYDKVLAMYE